MRQTPADVLKQRRRFGVGSTRIPDSGAPRRRCPLRNDNGVALPDLDALSHDFRPSMSNALASRMWYYRVVVMINDGVMMKARIWLGVGSTLRYHRLAQADAAAGRPAMAIGAMEVCGGST